MKREIFVGMILAILSIAMIQSVTCNQDLKRTLDNLPQAFRLLVVEGVFRGGARQQSGQYFIKALTRFPNWNNVTTKAYIHLLSRYTKEECVNEAKPYWTGNSTKENVRNEVLNFLGSATSNELVIFYCITDGLPLELYLDKVISANELLSWLEPIKGTVCVILDSCYSGSFASDGQASMLGPQRVILCSSMSNQLSFGKTEPYFGGYFTGYSNETSTPEGLIESTIAGIDANGDGWLSMMECFTYAQASVQQLYPVDSKFHQDPVAYNGLPGNYDPPLVQLQLPSVRDIAITGIQCKNVTSNSTYTPIKVTAANHGNLTETFNVTVYINNTSIETQTVNNLPNGSSTNLTFTWNTAGFDYGNYNMSAYATPVPGETDTTDNTFSCWIIVTIPGDIDGNFKVNLNDLVLLAKAYSSKPGDTNWNPNADIDGNLVVGLSDLVILAQNYGKTT